MGQVQESKIATVRKLRDFAASLKGATQRWAEKYADRRHYDKQGFGFVWFNARGGNAFSANISFEAYVGTYGSSSTSGAWRLDDALAKRYFIAALNCHKQAIFDTMAELAEADAVKELDAARAELMALQTMLDSVENPPAAVEQVSA